MCQVSAFYAFYAFDARIIRIIKNIKVYTILNICNNQNGAGITAYIQTTINMFIYDIILKIICALLNEIILLKHLFLQNNAIYLLIMFKSICLIC